MNTPRPVPMLGWAPAVELALPGSKSVANRLLVAAALTETDVTVHDVPASDDVQHLLQGLRTLGYAVAHDAAGTSVTIGADHSRSLSSSAITAVASRCCSSVWQKITDRYCVPTSFPCRLRVVGS